MTTTLDLIHATARNLLGTSRESLNRLNGSVTSGATTWTLERNLDDITEGSYLSVDLEVVYVWEKNDSAKTVTVQRGMIGSTPAAHDSQAVVTVNARFPQYTIFEALQQEFRDLSAAGLYRMKTKTLTTSATSYVYDLAADDVIDVYDVRFDPAGPENNYPRVPFQWMYGVPTEAVPNGPAIFLPGTVESGRNLQVWYKAKLGTLTGLTDNVETVTGIPPTAVDIPPLGAAARLLGPRESVRVQIESQPETRRLDEVPVGSTARAGQNLLAYRQQRLGDEMTRLAAQYPTLTRVHVR